jgi:cytochrome c peroxidase
MRDGNKFNNIVDFLNATAPYPELFKNAFGTATINSQQLLRALTLFVAPMVSANSKYDLVMRNQKGQTFTSDESAGYQLFKEKCANCHTEPLFTDLSYKNNGLDLLSKDEGRKIITGLRTDQGKFKVPTLRNIALSAPYMHDGRFNTLLKVLDHYTSGVQQHENLDPKLAGGIQLTSAQKQQLITFLNTLTDDEFIKNTAFSEQ